MTNSQTMAFGLWLLTIISLSVLVLSIAPALARSLFRERLDAIADDCNDALLDDRLMPSPAVESFLEDLSAFKNVARQLTFHRVGMIVLALHDLGVDFSDHHSPSFAQLGQDERRLLHSLMGRTNHALASYLRWGSPMGWVMAPVADAVARSARTRRRRPARNLAPLNVEKVAAQFNQAGAVNELRPRRRPHLVA